jgi:hypothetical protein
LALEVLPAKGLLETGVGECNKAAILEEIIGLESRANMSFFQFTGYQAI